MVPMVKIIRKKNPMTMFKATDRPSRELANPHILLERTHEPDCRFVAAWLIKAAEAQEFWSEALNDPDFSDRIGLIHAMAIPQLAAFALEILGELDRSRHIAALGLYSDEIGLFCSELTLLVRLGFFVCTGKSYQMVVPDTITLATVKQAALDVLSTAEDGGDGIEILLPERLLHTLPQAEAEAWRSRLIEIRDFSSYTPTHRKMH
jgi:hypothetical protein